MTNNKDYLSQEEIDALLRQSAETSSAGIRCDRDPAGGLSDDPMEAGRARRNRQHYVRQRGHGAVYAARQRWTSRRRRCRSSPLARAGRTNFPKPHVAVHVKYVEGFQGINLLVIKTEDAQVIADLMLGGDGRSQRGRAERNSYQRRTGSDEPDDGIVRHVDVDDLQPVRQHFAAGHQHFGCGSGNRHGLF